MAGKNSNKLMLKTPASWWGNMWREALPSGNGEVGAAVYGGVQDETIMITHSNLWHWGRKDRLPDVAHTLPEARRLLDEQKYDEASWHLTRALEERDYQTRLASRFPVADLKLSMACANAFKHYSRCLDMETGEVSVSWKDGETGFSRKLFVSRADDAIVYELQSDSAPIDAVLCLAFHPSETPYFWQEERKQLEQTVETRLDGEYICYAGKNDDGTDFGAVARVIASGGSMTIEAEGMKIEGADSILVIIKAFIKSERQAAWRLMQQELAAITPNYNDLLNAHVKLHSRLFHTVELELGDEQDEDNRCNEELMLAAYDGEAPLALIRKMWAYGRYLFISGVQHKGQPFGLYGIWGGDYRLTWDHHMANINIQMMYWHAGTGGLIELLPTFIDYYESMMDDFRENAKKLFGCRGIYIPAGSTPGIGVPNQVVPVIMNWTGGAGWIAQHYYEYYLYTGDTTFLSEKALPFMREVALFYEDFLVLDDDGLYKYYPSVSPENTPQNFIADDKLPLNHPMPTTINATSDFAIMKELLTNLLEGSRIAGIYEHELDKWERMLKHIPPYQLNSDGAVREWMHEAFDDRYEHRHLSHTYPVFPGKEFMREERPELFAAFETAINKRLINAQSGWSLMYMASLYARLGDGNRALDCLDMLSRSCLLNNFYTLHNDWRNMGISLKMEEAPIQMDANIGWSNAVQEMLIYIAAKNVKLLPALPERWAKGRIKDISFHTGKVTMAWDVPAQQFSAHITAERSTSIVVYLPAMFDRLAVKGEGADDRKLEIGRYVLEVKLEAGQSLRIEQ